MHARRSSLGALTFLLLTGCPLETPTPLWDLPAGWEGAGAHEVSLAPATDGCGSQAATTVSAGLLDGRLEVLVDGLELSCAQEQQGFIRERDGGFDVLIQPADMHPDALAGCVCASRLRVSTSGAMQLPAVGMDVEVFWRPSYEEAEDPQPGSVGSATVVDGLTGCDALAPCDVGTPCDNAGGDPSEYWEECIDLAGCGPVCISAAEACVITCSSLQCVVLESFPEQISCE